MLTFLLFPLLITTNALTDLLQLPLAIKAVPLALFIVVLWSDCSRLQFSASTDKPLIGVALAVQFIYSLNLFSLRYSSAYADIDSGSLFHSLATGIIPLGLLVISSVALLRPKLQEVPWTVLGGMIVLAVNLPLAFSPLAALSTENLYGSIAASYSAIRGFRVALPGFPGVISGGVYAGIVALAAIAYFLSEKSGPRRITAAAATVICMMLVWLTETRSVLLTLIPILGLLAFGGFKKLSNFPKLTASVAVCVPMLMTLIYPGVAERVVAISPEFVEARLSRGWDDNIWMLNGRVGLWEDFRSIVPSPVNALLGYGPLGEYRSGMADVAAERSTLNFRYPQALHAHNLFLNIAYENGAVGIAAFSAFLWLLVVRCLETFNRDNSPVAHANAVLIISLCSEGTVESLFSQNYHYFTPLCVVLACELLIRENVRSAAQATTRFRLTTVKGGNGKLPEQAEQIA